MRNLIEFFLRYSSWIVFSILMILSLAMLVSNGRYHSSVWFTSANAFSSKVYGVSNGITGYFNLRSINQELQQSNAQLENEVLSLRRQIEEYQSIVGDSIDSSNTKRYDFVLGTVLNNSTRHPRNYFTINKGSDDGVTEGLGVVDQNGIVGIVNVSGKNTARIISVLNNTQRISVKLKDTQMVGSLVWKGNDPRIAYVEEIPRHAVYNVGDTIVTSGFSTTFPADIPVGTVMGRVRSADDNFYILKIRLASDFNNLSTVRVLKDAYKSQLDSLTNYDITD